MEVLGSLDEGGSLWPGMMVMCVISFVFSFSAFSIKIALISLDKHLQSKLLLYLLITPVILFAICCNNLMLLNVSIVLIYVTTRINMEMLTSFIN